MTSISSMRVGVPMSSAKEDTNHEVRARHIGIIGFGNYGKLWYELARRFAQFSDVFVYEPTIPPDGRTFKTLKEIADCDIIVLAVPLHNFRDALQQLLAQDNLRKETVLVEVCTAKRLPQAILHELVGDRPYVSLHSMWGPDAYKNVHGDVSKLPLTVVAEHTVPQVAFDRVHAYLELTCGFRFEGISPEDHDIEIVGKRMFPTHLISQILKQMGRLNDDAANDISPLSWQSISDGALAVAADEELFLDLWLSQPECDEAFEQFMAAAERLRALKLQRVAAQ